MDGIIIQIIDSKVKVVNGNRRLKAMLETNGSAIVHDADINKDVEVIFNDSGEIVLGEPDIKAVKGI
jgi:hypothetical protein